MWFSFLPAAGKTEAAAQALGCRVSVPAPGGERNGNIIILRKSNKIKSGDFV